MPSVGFDVLPAQLEKIHGPVQYDLVAVCNFSHHFRWVPVTSVQADFLLINQSLKHVLSFDRTSCSLVAAAHMLLQRYIFESLKMKKGKRRRSWTRAIWVWCHLVVGELI